VRSVTGLSGFSSRSVYSEIFGAESSPGTKFSPSTAGLPLWYHSINAPYSVNLSAMVCNRGS
jgi:hypothetical protein